MFVGKNSDAAFWSHAHFSSNLFALFQRAEYFLSDIRTFLNPEHTPEKNKIKYSWNIRGKEEKCYQKRHTESDVKSMMFSLWREKNTKMSVWVTFMLSEISVQLTKQLIIIIMGKTMWHNIPGNVPFYSCHKKKMQYMIYFVCRLCTHNKSLINIKIWDGFLTQKWTIHEWQIMSTSAAQ